MTYEYFMREIEMAICFESYFKEEDLLSERLNLGQISKSEHNKQMRALVRELRECVAKETIV